LDAGDRAEIGVAGGADDASLARHGLVGFAAGKPEGGCHSAAGALRRLVGALAEVEGDDVLAE